jgi:hypothetical protein
VVVASPKLSAQAARSALSALRSRGIAAILHPEETAAAYALAWRFTHLCTPSGSGFEVRRVDARESASARVPDVEALARAIQSS